MGHIAQELIEQLSSEDLKAQLDQQHDLVKKLSYLKLQQTAETVANMQKGITAFSVLKPKPSQQTGVANQGNLSRNLTSIADTNIINDPYNEPFSNNGLF